MLRGAFDATETLFSNTQFFVFHFSSAMTVRFSLLLRTMQTVRGPKCEIYSVLHIMEHRSVVFCLTIHRGVSSE